MPNLNHLVAADNRCEFYATRGRTVYRTSPLPSVVAALVMAAGFLAGFTLLAELLY